MAGVDTRLVLDNKQTTYYGGAVTDSSSGTITLDILAGKSYTIQTRFAVPRSATAGVGSTVNNITIAYTINSGTLTSASALLNRITQQNGVAPSLSVNLLGAPTTAFGLIAGSFRAVVPVAAPAIDNQANTITIAYLITLSLVASTNINISFSNAEVNFTYVSVPLAPTFNNITLTDATNQITMGPGPTTKISATTPAANRVVTIADAGGDSSMVLTEGNQTINGNKTFSGLMGVTNALLTNQITGWFSNANITISPDGTGDILLNAGGATKVSVTDASGVVFSDSINMQGNQIITNTISEATPANGVVINTVKIETGGTITKDGADLTLATTTSGNLSFNPFGSIVCFKRLDTNQLSPNIDATYDIGSNGTKYRSAFFSGTVTGGNVTLGTLGNKLSIKEGANGSMGSAVLVGGTVTVANTLVTASSRIFLTSQVDGGAVGFLRISARVAATSFTITSSSGTDTSTVAWLIVEPAP
jgi:hypothetical protein